MTPRKAGDRGIARLTPRRPTNSSRPMGNDSWLESGSSSASLVALFSDSVASYKLHQHAIRGRTIIRPALVRPTNAQPAAWHLIKSTVSIAVFLPLLRGKGDLCRYGGARRFRCYNRICSPDICRAVRRDDGTFEPEDWQTERFATAFGARPGR